MAITKSHRRTSVKSGVATAPFTRGLRPRGVAPRAGLYARVSTHDQQTLPMQLAAMRDYVRKRGWQTAIAIKDIGPGANLRPQREELLQAARRREIDLVLVWRLDRWGALWSTS